VEKLLLRPVEVAECLGIGRSKTYELIGSGVIPSIRIGSSVRVTSDGLRAWIAAQAENTTRAEVSQRLEKGRR
jgi:excisionase family DNA binding protein